MPVSDPQIILRLDIQSGLVYAEAPGTNGARQKLGPFSIVDFPGEITNNLLDQRDASRAREADRLRQTQLENIRNTVHAHGLPLAKKVWHNGELAFSRAIKRSLAADNSSPKPKSAPRAKPQPDVEPVDLHLDSES